LLYRLVVPGPIEDVYEVRVLEWHGSVNHAIAPGDLMVELETHKAVIEVRAGQQGILRAILCREGDWQKIGEPLAILSNTMDEPLPISPDGLMAWQADFEIV
jgi:pyruvate/2-oxoglutarate dehydrogenase complex dihydrolipoamide acyltransferase (E2) component